MFRKKAVLIVYISLISLIAISCNNSTQRESGESRDHIEDTVGVENQVTGVVYTCPMHPEVTSDKPGECPKCGMTLIKSEKQDSADSSIDTIRS